MGRTYLKKPHFTGPVFRKAFSLLKKSGKILVYGDEDPDGMTASAILTDVLIKTGFNADYYVPSRDKEGIGLNKKRIRYFADRGVDLIITVDCGSVNHDEIEYAASLGLNVIITDHHIPYKGIPKSVPFINHHVLDESYFNHLSGSGTALIFAAYIFKKMTGKKCEELFAEMPHLQALAGIGTLCDKVKKTPYNRHLISEIKHMPEFFPEFRDCSSEQCICGIIHGSKTTGLKNPAVDIFLGRIKAGKAAKQVGIWKRKKTVYRKNLEKLMKKIEKKTDINSNVILIYAPDIRSQYTGALASMITYKYRKPVCIIGRRNGILTGEARASVRFRWVSVLKKYAQFFENWGGHDPAAGFSIRRKNVEAFIDRFNTDFNG